MQRLLAVALLSLALSESAVWAQSTVDGEVTRDVVLLEAEELAAISNGPRYKKYTEDNELRIEFALINKTKGPLIYNQDVVRTLTVSARHIDGTPLPVTSRWEEGVFVPGERGRSTRVFINGPALLEANVAPSWVVVVKRADGKAFSSGEYVVSVNTPSIVAIVQKPDGAAWSGRDLHGLWDIRFVVKPPSSAEERKAHYQWAVSDAFTRQAYDEALAMLALLRVEDPDSMDAELQEADALNLAGRYHEANSKYERLIPRMSQEARQLYRTVLARSYLVGAKDEANARRVLRERGVPADELSAEIESLRDGANAADR